MTEPIPYATPAPPRSKHDTIYTVLLGVTSFFSLIGAIEMWFVASASGHGNAQHHPAAVRAVGDGAGGLRGVEGG
jgi:hypothetical protein